MTGGIEQSKAQALDCLDEGSGPAILLLHGCPGDQASFAPVVEALRDGYRVLVPSLPGYEQSPRLEPYSLSGVRQRLEHLLASKGVDSLAAAVGFSFGTYRALDLLLTGSVRARAVCALGGFAGLSVEEREGLAGFVPVLRGRTSQDAMLQELLAQRCLSAAHRRSHPGDDATIHTWLAATTPDVMADEIEAYAGLTDLHEALALAPFRLFVRVGSEDVPTPPAQARRMVAAARDASLEVVPDAGHSLMIEDASATAAWVRRCVDQVAG